MSTLQILSVQVKIQQEYDEMKQERAKGNHLPSQLVNLSVCPSVCPFVSHLMSSSSRYQMFSVSVLFLHFPAEKFMCTVVQLTICCGCFMKTKFDNDANVIINLRAKKRSAQRKTISKTKKSTMKFAKVQCCIFAAALMSTVASWYGV